jgi:hypothetical protein
MSVVDMMKELIEQRALIAPLKKSYFAPAV